MTSEDLNTSSSWAIGLAAQNRLTFRGRDPLAHQPHASPGAAFSRTGLDAGRPSVPRHGDIAAVVDEALVVLWDKGRMGGYTWLERPRDGGLRFCL